MRLLPPQAALPVLFLENMKGHDISTGINLGIGTGRYAVVTGGGGGRGIRDTQKSCIIWPGIMMPGPLSSYAFDIDPFYADVLRGLLGEA